ncbi:hypothetical protein L226DRAFT_536775 [Lentinus tigrinus ALCF2SS1-7]|uniref:ASX DEUBAD domain-containing protein n=1 Tax=Lentinus tigrinus ALCF2SS1-6 TaxID=1328759 RepID=A0A5C2S422_9APHY|nr:hypothetical protein L227DRAFT_577301 [Lentinus tigrinus ALCF2SS1-6]RPD72932.1 hypothetical protein L226DRAFT_536775 [Lentinus tigrinus ALCF2SS1-7]
MADNSEASGSTRPRRIARTPAKTPARKPADVDPVSQDKRKARTSAKSPAEELYLTHTKSHLAKIDISNVLNYNHFLELSKQSQLRLCSMLPPTAFI